MQRLVAGGIMLGAAMVGALIPAGPTAAQESKSLQMALSAERIEPGQSVDVTSIDPCLPDLTNDTTDPRFTEVDVSVSLDGDVVDKATVATVAGDWSWTWQTAGGTPTGTYTITATCLELGPADRTPIGEYDPVTVTVKKPDRIGPPDPEPFKPETPSAPPFAPPAPIGAGFATELAPAIAVPGRPTFTG